MKICKVLIVLGGFSRGNVILYVFGGGSSIVFVE